MPATSTILTLALAACAAPKDGRRDSVDTLPQASPPAVVGETARVTAEPMPSVGPRDSAARMPAARASGGAAPMPNATTPAPSPAPSPARRESTTSKKPPTRVVPDPVLPPRDSAARRP